MPVDGKEYKRVTLSLRPDEYEVLRFVAFKRRTTVTGVVRERIQDLLEEEEDIRDGLAALEDKADLMDWETFKKEHLGL